MKTHTIIFGVNYSTEQVLRDFNGKVGYSLIHRIETPLNKYCEYGDEVFDTKLDYEVFKEHHNNFIRKSK
jgi:hypothetical protein